MHPTPLRLIKEKLLRKLNSHVVPLENPPSEDRIRRTQTPADAEQMCGVGIEPDHLAAAPHLAMAAFISSIEIALRALPNMPFKAVTDRVAATNS